MRSLRKAQLRLRSLFRRARVESDLDTELRFHFDQQLNENLARGMNRHEARLAALKTLGGTDQMKEECRDERRVNFIDHLVHDLRFAFRMLGKSPGFTALTVLTLALGIGATTAIFTVVDSVLLRPLKYPDANRIVKLEPFRSGRQAQVAPANFLDWRQQARSYDSMAAIFVRGANLLVNGEPERVQVSMVSASFFQVLGIQPQPGRGFSSDDEKPGHQPVAVISHHLSQQTFHSDPAAIGKAITIDDQLYDVIGVTPAGFDYPGGTDLWLPPNRVVPELNGNFGDPAQIRGLGYLSVIARLNSNAPVLQAQSEIDAINTKLDQAYPDANKAFTVQVVKLQDSLVGGIRPVLILLLAAVASLLLIACANVANLMLARASSRQREVAIRTSLGATLY
ncbi:MAG: ABC transporter permease, partial [Blastocatellia bacterium]